MAPAPHPTLLGVDVLMVATFLAAVATFAVLVAIYAATTVKDPMAKRVKALNERREQLKAGIVASTSKRRRNITNRNEVADKVRPLLDSFPDWGSIKRFGLVAGTLVLSYKAPDIWLKNKIGKRTTAIRKGLPDALDLLVICAEAGLTVDAAFNRVAKELGRAYPALGDEFALTAIELSFLTERRQAFENFAYRVDLDSVRGVVTTMIQTERYGTPLASALRVLSAEFRNERMMRAEEKAARLPAIMTVPLILFILPVLFIVILGPAACSIADAFSATGPVNGHH